ncbi:ABC transporter ATP-binding protein [Thiothrix sp. UBA2332]|uniref:ABC transporter ATP-binding protein n=1 Tax=Thiothrix sp. UBA2332 TaxID=1947696 RepID=UPI000BD43560|nr:ABC transporter ATP-binding protein [Thiothrix sp. UBA2332]OZA24375.1 MAG: ABC transporter ATP-binding protein [Hydrogenophilales bacterium 17-64-11]HRK78000.1 ABC transporter ATP-binding protein [Thiobacillus sp.]
MSSGNAIIQVSGLSKCYQIYGRPQDRLRQAIVPRLQRLAGRPPVCYYQDFWALREVSFEVGYNETVGIVGRNGSGKSTLLQLICGTLSPTAGKVETHGRIAALLELGAGFNPEFTGRENVYLNAAVLGLSQDEIRGRFDAIAAFADIGPFIDQPVKTYSSGMVVRLAFSVAINVEPDILVVDEALAVGDELFQRKCFSRIEALKAGGTTVLFVSHSGSTVVELCDRAILLEGGELLAMGSPRHIVGHYQKLLYAPPDRRPALLDEMRTGEKASTQAGMRLATAAQAEAPHPEMETAFFDPNLQPLSTLSYESIGAAIETPRITTEAGEPVNCLVRGQTYRYRYGVRFAKAATQVRFAMLIKTMTGLAVSGTRSAPSLGEALPFVEAGAYLEAVFEFVCRLNPGTYFLNAGVLGTDGGEEFFLHRLVDACAFRVLPVSGDTATEIANLCQFVSHHER